MDELKKTLFNKFPLLPKLAPPSPTFNTSVLIKKMVRTIGAGGRILDLGCGSRKLGGNVVKFDLIRGANVDIVGDAHLLPFKHQSFDAVIITAVLEHVKDPTSIVLEIYRVLKNGGLVYAEVPFIEGYHEDPVDYRRFTIIGLSDLFIKFEERDKGVCAGPSSSLNWILREYFAILSNNEYISLILKFIVAWLIFPLKYLDLILAKRKNAHRIAAGVYFLGKKS
jgi:SAM-dependent methyltransferase